MWGKKIKRLSDIWHDNVWGSVISAAILAGIVWLFKTISSKILELMDFFKIDIPLYVCLLELALLLSVIIRLIVFIKEQKKVILGKDNEIKNQSSLIQNLQEEINELKKEPNDPRMGMFKEGDNVVINNSNLIFPTEYTVVGKDKSEILIVDKNGSKMKISPHALLSNDEYEIEKRKEQTKIDRLLNLKKTINPWGFD